jgi:hypothetical protein
MNDVVPLFRRRFAKEEIPEAVLPTMPGFGQGQRGPIAVSKVNLADKPKVWCLIGAGSVSEKRC